MAGKEHYYNEEKKLEFLQEITAKESGLGKRLFRTSAPLEEQYKKDLSTFSVNDVMAVYRLCNFRSLGTARGVHRIFKKYSHYVIKEINPAYLTITDSMLESIMNKAAVSGTLVTSEDLDEWEHQLRYYKIWNPVDMFIVRAVFEGINGNDMQDLERLTLNNFYYEKGKHYVQFFDEYPKRIEVTEKLRRLAEEANAATCYYVLRKDTGYRKGTIIPYEVSGDTIIKELEKTNMSRSNFANRVSKRFMRLRKILDVEHLSLKNIEMGGIVEKIKAKADENGIDIIDYISMREHTSEIRKILQDYNRTSDGSIQMVKKYIGMVYGEENN